jgi:hypothetical protein
MAKDTIGGVEFDFEPAGTNDWVLITYDFTATESMAEVGNVGFGSSSGSSCGPVRSYQILIFFFFGNLPFGRVCSAW